MPYKQKKNGNTVWMAQVKIDGKKIRRQFTRKDDAKKWEVDQKELAKLPPEPETHTTSYLEWANCYLDFAVKYSPKTYSEKRTAFKRLLKTVDPQDDVHTFKKMDALKYLQRIYKQRTGYAANKERKNMAAAWNFGIKYLEGFPAVNPFLAVEKFPEQRQERYVPPQKDFWTTLNVAEGQNRVMLLTLLHTAARRGELYRLQWKDVDFSRKRIQLGTKKRQDSSMEYEWLPMTDELYEVLLAHRQNAVNEWVFTQQGGRFAGKPYMENRGFPQKLCKKAGVKPFGCHGVRHLTASILANNNVPMIAIQQILRHKKLATTERYVRGMEPIRPHLKILEGGLISGPTSGPTKQFGNGHKKKDLKLTA
ncbi:site-specific integrase [Pseudodesulfovibrio thermohalotolerans]|uniref:tyrosine-type recombinase/integrase n=1 Tax=Pseudodesulfovibrio thermohalotolerans TaxID=2880651 RepID=UPI0024420849|nr:site-specific integrase [Pseudodesulfovibrio thermohalotolerans]WFS63045.1 site-specific integrase [Pseudodesulfovibrio thermohalotolerans]